MLYDITHTLEYNYKSSVELHPYTIRLKPRHDCTQHLLSFKCTIDPLPISMYENLDHDGNVVIIAHFEGHHRHLVVTLESQVETKRGNPFEYILDKSAVSLYNPYTKEQRETLKHYLHPRHPDPLINNLVKNFLQQTDYQTIPFLTKAADYVYQNYRSVLRAHGAPLPPREVIETKLGTCRDFALLYMEFCRAAGLASRFVSGYSEDNPDLAIEKQEMHSWAEVYLPGAGWRGFDASLGLATADWHISLATGADPHEAASTSGSFKGFADDHEFNYHILLKNLDSTVFARPKKNISIPHGAEIY